MMILLALAHGHRLYHHFTADQMTALLVVVPLLIAGILIAVKIRKWRAGAVPSRPARRRPVRY